MRDWKEWVVAFLATSWVMTAAPRAWEVLLPLAEGGLRNVIESNTLLIYGSGPHRFGTSGVSEPSIKLETLDPMAFSLNVTDFVTGGVRNNVFHLAYNRAQDGSQDVLGEPSLSLAIQSRFPMSGQDHMGYAIDYTSGDGTTNRRFLELDVNRLTNAGRWRFDGHEINLKPDTELKLETLDPARFTLHVGSFTVDDVRDNVLYLGYNRTRVGEQEVLGEPSLAFAMESRYLHGGREFMEYSLDYTSADGGMTRRFLGFEVERSMHAGAWGFAGELIRVEQNMNDGHFVFIPRGPRRTVFRYAGGQNELMQIGYDGTPSAPDAIHIGPSALSNPEFEIKRLQATQSGELAASFYGNYGTPGRKQLRVGPLDSGGPGFRVLIVPND